MRVPPDNIRLSDGSLIPSQDPLITAIALAILIPVCIWVYRDARKRYDSPHMPMLWSLLVFLVLIIFLPLYLTIRPPVKK